MLEKLITSKTRAKILQLLVASPDSEFHVRDIARKIKISAPQVAKELKHLAFLNVVNKKSKANLIFFSINTTMPMYSELKNVFMSSTEKRKSDHINIVKKYDVNFRKKTTGLEDVELVYSALPELNKDEIDLSNEFLCHKFSAPLMVSGMTGGTKEAAQINKDIAQACEELGIGMGIGSQRAMLEKPELMATYNVRDVAPNVFIAGNIGAVQLKQYSTIQIKKMLQDIGANALAIHINAAQEIMQFDGDFDFRNVLSHIDRIARSLDTPVYVKEVGHGISHEIAKMLNKTKICAIDVQGAGGTSWIGIDSLRGCTELGEVFWDFGVPTALSLIECRHASNKPLIASGGIRTGLDAVKCFALGANMVSIAKPVILAQEKSGAEGITQYLQKIIEEIKVSMFLIGAKNIKELRKKPVMITGKLKEMLELREISVKKFMER